MATTKEQQRAAFALKKITSACGEKVSGGTVSFIQGAPSQILQNGLGQAMAFWAAKKDGDKELVFGAVAGWLVEAKIASTTQPKDFLTALNSWEIAKYLKAQKEALAFLQWLKRYAKAFAE